MNALVKIPATRLAPCAQPRPIARYGETRLSMEERFLARMLLAQKKPAPAEEQERPSYTPAQHKKIRSDILNVSKGRWASSFTIAQRVKADRDVVGSKISEMVRQGVLLAKGPRNRRLYKLNPDKTETQSRRERIQARVELVAKMIADKPGSTLGDVKKAAGLTKAQAETALETLFKHGRVNREHGANRAFRYFTADIEEKAA